jgi:Ca-activated chloride channel family protein
LILLKLLSKYKTIKGVCLLCLLLLLPLCAWGQSGRIGTHTEQAEGQGAAPAVDDVLRVRTDEVSLPVSVRGMDGVPVAGLGQESFFIYENGVRQEISSFNRERVPANIVLLMDASGSVFSQMRLIRLAAKGFIKGLLEQDQVCVMQFADQAELLQDWTRATDTEKLSKALEWRYHPGQSTVFYDGLYLAAEQQLSKVGGRHIIILLTDGIDTAAHQRASFADALSAVRRADTSVYVLSLTQEMRSLIEKESAGKLARLFNGADASGRRLYLNMLDAAERQLDELARQTGGRMFLPQKETDLGAAYDAIALELRTQYIITYKPKPRAAAGEYRRIRVLVAPGSYEVGAREGYTGRA